MVNDKLSKKERFDARVKREIDRQMKKKERERNRKKEK